MTCKLSKLSKNIEKNCDVIVPGVDDLLYFIRFDDVDKALCTFDSLNPTIIKSIVLSGSPTPKAYTVQGQRMSNKKSNAYAPTDYAPAWTHSMAFLIFDNDPETKARIVEMSNDKYMILYKNNYVNRNKLVTPQDSTWELAGYDSGLYLSEAKDDDDAANGGWSLKAATKDKAKEGYPPLQVFDTDIATTNTMISNLI